MRIFGLDISFASRKKELSPVDSGRGWWPVIRESFTGAWQRNVSINVDSVMSHHAVFACQTLIASDVAKLEARLVEETSDGIWVETKNPAYSPVLRKPNAYQNRIQFFETWVLSKLSRGNAYILKQRDGRGVVTKLYVLDPNRCRPLVADDGSVFYELMTDTLSEIPQERLVVPAREIIHDRFNCLFHPLVGLSPIYANGLAATQGLAIQNNSTLLFQNGARPSGILTAPGDIKQETATELKAYWESNFSGSNAAKVAVLGDGLQYQAMTMNAVEAEVIDQLKWTAEVICSTYHVPPFMVGLGAEPNAGGVQDRTLRYYTQCLQLHLEAIELCLDEGLGIGKGVVVNGKTLGTEFDVDNLLRMDSATQMETLDKGKNYLTPNEGRKKIGLGKTPGGDVVLRQQQDFSLEALAKRDAQDDPFGTAKPAAPQNDNEEKPAELSDEDKRLIMRHSLREELEKLKKEKVVA